MAKKHKFDAATPEMTSAQPGEPVAEAEPKAPKVRAGYYLKASQPDAYGRTDYRLGKEANYPKKPNEMPITIDGLDAVMAVTTSGGWANEDTKGFNGWLKFDHPIRGHIQGWILFGHKVDPREMKLDFTTVDGTCEANPKRLPASPESEAKRIEAARAKFAAKKAAEPAKTETVEVAPQ